MRIELLLFWKRFCYGNCGLMGAGLGNSKMPASGFLIGGGINGIGPGIASFIKARFRWFSMIFAAGVIVKVIVVEWKTDKTRSCNVLSSSKGTILKPMDWHWAISKCLLWLMWRLWSTSSTIAWTTLRRPLTNFLFHGIFLSRKI